MRIFSSVFCASRFCISSVKMSRLLSNEDRLQKFIEVGLRPVKLPCTRWVVEVECVFGHTFFSKQCKRLANDKKVIEMNLKKTSTVVECEIVAPLKGKHRRFRTLCVHGKHTIGFFQSLTHLTRVDCCCKETVNAKKENTLLCYVTMSKMLCSMHRFSKKINGQRLKRNCLHGLLAT